MSFLGTKDVGIMRVRLSPVIGLRICRAIGGHPRTSSVFLSSKKDFYKVTHGGLELSLQSGQASSFLASCLRPPSSWHVRLMLPGPGLGLAFTAHKMNHGLLTKAIPKCHPAARLQGGLGL